MAGPKRSSVFAFLCIPPFPSDSLSMSTHKNGKGGIRKMPERKIAPMLSGEILKEPFVDVFFTDSEQIAYSLPLLSHTTFSNSRALQRQFEKAQPSQKLDSVESSSSNNPQNLKSTPFQKQHTSKVKSLQEVPASLQIDAPQTPLPKRKLLRRLKLQENTENHITNNLTAFLPISHQTRLKAGYSLHLHIGDIVHSGDTIGECRIGEWTVPLVVADSGKVVRISQSKLILQKVQPVLYYSQAFTHVRQGEWVEQNTPILTLTHQTLLTGDIVQGIPRIEQLFEAPNSPPSALKEKAYLHETLHSQLRDIFRQNWKEYNLPTAVRKSFEQIQHILVESLQKVYLSQGVLIADKHIEIVVRQMTSRALVLDSGDTGLLLQELLSVQHIERANLVSPGQKAVYAPAVVGLTRSALESDSFISAASFQETTRVLSRDAAIGKTDFLRGLKERVVIGDLIGAGTGLDAYFVYGLVSPQKSLSAMQIPMIEPKVSSYLPIRREVA